MGSQISWCQRSPIGHQRNFTALPHQLHFSVVLVAASTFFETKSINFKSCSLQGRVSAEAEDFFIEVSPGTYSITASMPESQQQTQLVSVKAGESVDLTFNLWPVSWPNQSPLTFNNKTVHCYLCVVCCLFVYCLFFHWLRVYILFCFRNVLCAAYSIEKPYFYCCLLLF